MKKTRPTKKAKSPTSQVVGVCVFLALAVLVVFAQTARFQFVNYDDEESVYSNPVVAQGLSIKAVGWGFTHAQTSNWIPLTTLSHMLDCQLFGLSAGAHHLVNVLWHAANAVLLFLVLRQLTGRLWPSAFVAVVFAIHPLRAESVAWISERKDVLSGFFFLLAVGAYARQARKPSAGRYSLVVLLFALGLLAKTMVATLPFVLLLLDYWPLGRFRDRRQFAALVKEKIPLFVLSVRGVSGGGARARIDHNGFPAAHLAGPPRQCSGFVCCLSGANGISIRAWHLSTPLLPMVRHC